MKNMHVLLWLCFLLLGMPLAFSQSSVKKGNPELYKVYKGLEAFGIPEAWKMGIDGSGVNVAVMDSGIDFGGPDLMGTQARVADKQSPYCGWPIVIDLHSLTLYQKGQSLRSSYFADTSSTDTENYILPKTSKSGVYHIGNHPDQKLTNYYGNPVKVLVVDEAKSGMYDTVYVDLNNNRDFGDDKPCRRGDEIASWDRNGDGFSDESGGMIYFISNGRTPLPFSVMLFADKAKIPAAGDLVAFHFDRGSHGTMCAGTIAAQGKNVWGLAPGAKLIPIISMGNNEAMRCLLAALGYDGKPGTGDEAQIVSRSAGFSYFQKGADELSAIVEHISSEIAPLTIFVYGAGNHGAGYGSGGAPANPRMINAGAIQDLWWLGSPHRGDVVCFSSRGPNVMGQVKPNVLATGYFAPEVIPLSYSHFGKSAWDWKGGGTSDATPHTSGILALIFQAYKAAHGHFPDNTTARDILMSSATDINEEVFAQGSGIINAKEAVDIALSRSGALFQPAYFFSSPVEAESQVDFSFRLSNFSREPVTLHPLKLYKKEVKKFTIRAEEDDRLFMIPTDILGGNLVKVSSISAKDNQKRRLEDTVGYIVNLYDWVDLNHDGKYGPGTAVKLADSQDGELEPISISDWDHVITSEARIHDPRERIHDGLILGLTKECTYMKRHVEMESRDVTIIVESFEWCAWADFKLNRADNLIRCSFKAPEETGVYQGKILVSKEGDDSEQCIPISFSTFRREEFRIASSDEAYENARLYARFEGSGRMGFRDARFYPIYHQGSKEAVAIKLEWEDPGSDFDITLFGKGTVDSSGLWDAETDPPVELPVLPVLRDNGHSPRRISEIPRFTLDGATSKTVTAVLDEGLNFMVVNMTISGHQKYGENIKIHFKTLGSVQDSPVILECEAGRDLTYSNEGIDRIIGFGRAKSVSSYEYSFKARANDIIILRPIMRWAEFSLYHDTNANGKFDIYADKAILLDFSMNLFEKACQETVRLPYNGTYILSQYHGEVIHLKESYSKTNGHFLIPAPETSGSFVGIAEKSGQLLPLSFELTVHPAAAAKIMIETPDPVRNKQPFDVDLLTSDVFGNPAKADTMATVLYEEKEYQVKITDGTGTITLTAPDQQGQYIIKTKSQFGWEDHRLQVTDEPAIEIIGLKLHSQGITIEVRNWSESEIPLRLFVNPSCYLTPDLLHTRAMAPYASIFGNGYKAGYIPYSGALDIRLPQESIQEVSIPIAKMKDMVAQAVVSPFIAVAADNRGNVLAHKVTEPFTVNPHYIKIDPEALTPLTEITSGFSGKPIVFKAEGLVSVRMNNLQPLYFLPTIAGVLSVMPDEAGVLEIRDNKITHHITIASKKTMAGAEGKLTATESLPPEKIMGLKICSENGTLKLSWRQPSDQEIDCFNIYRLFGSRLRKIEEVNTLSFSLKEKAWESVTFCVSGVDQNGNEGPISDPIGANVIPASIR